MGRSTRSNPGETFYYLPDNLQDVEELSKPDSPIRSTNPPDWETASTTCEFIHDESSSTSGSEGTSTQVYSSEISFSMDGDGDGDGGDFHPHPVAAAATELITAAVSSASESFINPSFSSGTSSEDARDWWNYLENWIRGKNMNPENQARFFPPLFRRGGGGGAGQWFQGLEDDQKDKFEHLEAAFQTRYFPTDLSRWRTMSDMWTRKQKKSESVDDYVTALLRMARIANVKDRDVQRYAIIKGLLPDIRRHVLQQNPDTLAAVLAAGKVAEQSMKSDDPPEFIMAVNRLENKLDAISLSKESTTPQTPQSWSGRPDDDLSNMRPLLVRHSGSMPPYRNANTPPPYQAGGQFYSRQNRPQERTSDHRSNWRYNDNTTSRNNNRGRSEAQQSPTRSIIRQPPNQKSSMTLRKRVKFKNYDPNNSCRCCGLSNHRSGTCRFRNFYCYNCGKLGHLSRVCRSGRLKAKS